MKKIIILAVLFVTLLTGCGKEETMETKSELDMVYENAINTSKELEECISEIYITEEEFEENKEYMLVEVDELCDEYDVCEECINEIIELVNSVEYEPSLEFGFDTEKFFKDYILICIKYDLIPEYDGYTVDEIYEEEFL